MNEHDDISKPLFDKIERYLSNDMAADEQEEFTKMLENEPDLRDQVHEFEILFDAIETQSLKEKMEGFHEHIPEGEGVKLPHRSKLFSLSYKTMAVAACIIALLSLGGYWILYQNSNRALYNTYFSADPGLPTVMGSSDNFEFYDAMVNYKYGDYSLALSKWDEQLKAKPDNDTLNYFAGVSKMALQDTKSAIANLEIVVGQPSGNFEKEAQFYLGLAYLKNNNIDKALKHLKQSGLKEAQELIKELK